MLKTKNKPSHFKTRLPPAARPTNRIRMRINTEPGAFVNEYFLRIADRKRKSNLRAVARISWMIERD